MYKSICQNNISRAGAEKDDSCFDDEEKKGTRVLIHGL